MKRTDFSNVRQLLVATATVLATVLSGGVLAQSSAQKPSTAKWVVPRTPDGKPDLQGNWSTETQTPLERQGNGPLILTEAEAQAIETRAQQVEDYRDKASDPNRGAPPSGGDLKALVPPGQLSLIEQITAGAGGGVGGYNGFWLVPGTKVIRIDGKARSSIIVDPPNGHIPALTQEGQKIAAAAMAAQRRFGESDHVNEDPAPIGHRVAVARQRDHASDRPSLHRGLCVRGGRRHPRHQDADAGRHRTPHRSQ